MFLSKEARKGKQTTYRVESRRHGGLRDKGGNSSKKTRVQVRLKRKRGKANGSSRDSGYEAKVGNRGS